MKKVLISLTLVAIIATSCQKNYTCYCTFVDNSTTPIGMNKLTTQHHDSSSTINTESAAIEDCNNRATDLKNAGKETVNCNSFPSF